MAVAVAGYVGGVGQNVAKYVSSANDGGAH